MPRYDYFPLDEQHPAYPVETYSLSKYLAELQADSIARANPDISIATLRFHLVVPPSQRPKLPVDRAQAAKDAWGWTSNIAAARACLLALEMGDERKSESTTDSLKAIRGHEVFFVVDETHCCVGNAAMDIARRYFPSTEVRRELGADEGFYNCSKAKRLLGWEHNGGFEPMSNW